MTSEVDICNMALSGLGDEANITSIVPPDNSSQAHHCARFYPVALTVILDKHNWSFATRRANLVQTTNNTSEWTYCFALPSDYINVVSLKADGINEITEYATEIATIASADVTVLYTNAMPSELKYCSSAVSTTKFSPLFIEALSILVSYYLAGPILKGDVGVAAKKSLLQLFNVALSEAIESDSQNYKRKLSSAGYRPEGISARA